MKKIILCLYLTIILTFGMQGGYAQVVATVCIENKHGEKPPCDVTLYIENRLMDAFFDSGFIFTNLPYIKEEIDFYNSYKREQYAFESEPDYIVLLYFSYDGKRKYDEAKRKNLLSCQSIYCKVIKRNSSKVLYEKLFELEKLNTVSIYKKLDFCVSELNEKVVDAIRRDK